MPTEHLVLECDIPGAVVAKARARAAVRLSKTGKATVRHYTPKGTRSWEEKAADVFREETPRREIAVPVALHVTSHKKRPVSMSPKKRAAPIWCPTKPDGDNVLKIVSDALVRAGVLKDDNIVVRWSCDTLYAAKGAEPFVSVRLSTVEGEPDVADALCDLFAPEQLRSNAFTLQGVVASLAREGETRTGKRCASVCLDIPSGRSRSGTRARANAYTDELVDRLRDLQIGDRVELEVELMPSSVGTPYAPANELRIVDIEDLT